MSGLNLFANIDSFFQNDSIPSELDNTIDGIEVLQAPVVQKTSSKSGIRPKRNAKAKPNPTIEPDEVELSDSVIQETISPGVGQKTAFQKMNKLKRLLLHLGSLETAAGTETKNKARKRQTSHSSMQTALQKKRTRRAEAAATRRSEMSSATDVISSTVMVDESFDEDNLNLNIKIKWEGTCKIERIQFSKFKPFSALKEELGSRENINTKTLLLMFGNDVINADDSPHSIGYTLGKFISVRVVENLNWYIPKASSERDTIEVKVQYPQWKNPVICSLKLSDQFRVLTGICSEKLKVDPQKLRFKFDGDVLNLTDTPADMDFDGGEIIDLVVD